MVVQLVVGGDGVQLHLCETKWVVRQGKGNNLLGEWTKISIAFNKQGVEVEIGFLRGGGDNLLCRGGGRSIEDPVLEVQEGGVSAPEDLQQPQSLFFKSVFLTAFCGQMSHKSQKMGFTME